MPSTSSGAEGVVATGVAAETVGDGLKAAAPALATPPPMMAPTMRATSTGTEALVRGRALRLRLLVWMTGRIVIVRRAIRRSPLLR